MVRGADETPQGLVIDRPPGSQFYVTHEPAIALQEPLRIVKLRTTEEADVDMGRERVDVGKRRIINACSGLAIVNQLVHVVSTAAHLLEPALRDVAERITMPLHPGVNCRIAFH